MKTLAGRNAIVTGAAAGIGKAISKQLAGLGVNLCLVDIDEQGLERVADEMREVNASGQDSNTRIQVITRTCDLSDSSAVTDCVQSILNEWPIVHLLINNAGICFRGRSRFMTAQQWNQLLNINVHAPSLLINALLPMFLEQDEAHIVNIASVFGLVPYRRIAAYQTSKFAIVGLTESLRFELAGTGVGVSAICPGFVAGTDFFGGTADVDPRGTKEEPKWFMCTSVETIARKSVSAIRRNRSIVVFPLFWRLMWLIKRFIPGPLDLSVQWLWGITRRRRRRRKARKEKMDQGSG